LPSYVALVGDPADNLPKVPGIGPKIASSLIATHGSASALLANLAQVASARVESGSATRLLVHPTVVLETACNREMQLGGVDLDADGMDDVVLLITAMM